MNASEFEKDLIAGLKAIMFLHTDMDVDVYFIDTLYRRVFDMGADMSQHQRYRLAKLVRKYADRNPAAPEFLSTCYYATIMEKSPYATRRKALRTQNPASLKEATPPASWER